MIPFWWRVPPVAPAATVVHLPLKLIPPFLPSVKRALDLHETGKSLFPGFEVRGLWSPAHVRVKHRRKKQESGVVTYIQGGGAGGGTNGLKVEGLKLGDVARRCRTENETVELVAENLSLCGHRFLLHNSARMSVFYAP